METMLETFDDMVSELRAMPGVTVSCAWLGPPADPHEISRSERRLGLRLPVSLVRFYRLANGLQLRWTLEEWADGRSAGAPLRAENLAMMTDVACINILPVAELGYRVAGGHPADEEVVVRGVSWSLRELQRAFVPVDFYSTQAFSGIVSAGRWAADELMTLTGYGAEFPDQQPRSFEEHLQRAFGVRGLLRARGLHAPSGPGRADGLPKRWSPDQAFVGALIESARRSQRPTGGSGVIRKQSQSRAS